MIKSKNDYTQRNLWDTPWGYVESFLLTTGLLLTGFMLEVVAGALPVDLLRYPVSVVLAISYGVLLILLQKYFYKNAVIQWFTSVPATISILVSVLFMVLIMGSIPQSASPNRVVNTLGLNHITTHWAFLFIQFLLLTALGLVTVKRAIPFRKNNIGFILNHLGLFMALLAGILGNADFERLRVDIGENESSQFAFNSQNQVVPLGFSIRLNDFQLEEYPPKLAFVDNKNGKVLHNEGNNLYTIATGKTYYFKDIEVEIDTFLTSAGKIGDRYYPVHDIGTPPAALLSVKNQGEKEFKQAWISSGSFLYPYESYKINQDISVLMTLPEAKKFTSHIDITDGKETMEGVELIVNKPISYKGWKIYQLSYDERLGKWSQSSTLELVRDSWLPLVYVGIFMMIFGAVYLFWKGNPNR